MSKRRKGDTATKLEAAKRDLDRWIVKSAVAVGRVYNYRNEAKRLARILEQEDQARLQAAKRPKRKITFEQEGG